MKKDNEKTNVMRMLEQAGIPYKAHYYDDTITDGVSVAKFVGIEQERTFKTLVTIGSDLNHYVFVIPVAETLDLKKGAKSVGVKSVSMLKQKDLFPLTGYIHGGCSAIGMKKKFITKIDETAILFDEIATSGGKCGTQVTTSPDDFCRFIDGEFCDLTL